MNLLRLWTTLPESKCSRNFFGFRGRKTAAFLFVTHSIDEALLLGSRIVVIDQGKVRKEYQVDDAVGGRRERNLLAEPLIGLKKDILKQLNTDAKTGTDKVLDIKQQED